LVPSPTQTETPDFRAMAMSRGMKPWSYSPGGEVQTRPHARDTEGGDSGRAGSALLGRFPTEREAGLNAFRRPHRYNTRRRH
jgi:hypothetical protein